MFIENVELDSEFFESSEYDILKEFLGLNKQLQESGADKHIFLTEADKGKTASMVEKYAEDVKKQIAKDKKNLANITSISNLIFKYNGLLTAGIFITGVALTWSLPVAGWGIAAMNAHIVESMVLLALTSILSFMSILAGINKVKFDVAKYNDNIGAAAGKLKGYLKSVDRKKNPTIYANLSGIIGYAKGMVIV